MIINVLQYLENSAKRMPEKTALRDEQHSIVYQRLLELSQSIGTRLAALGAHNRAIAVFIDRNIESIVMFLGVVYSGNFYVPIDVSMPKQRMELMLQSLKPAACIGMGRASSFCPANIPFLSYEDLVQTDLDLQLLSEILSLIHI